MSNTDNNRFYKETIAFAGLLQAACLVEQIATGGNCQEEAFNTSIASIFKIHSASVEDIYGGQVNFVPGLALGMRQLHTVLEQNRPPQSDYFRYALGLLHLERKLRNNKALLEILSTRLKKTSDNLSHFDMTHERIIAGLAHIYEDTISTFRYRIHVSGNRLYLENPNNVHKIRTLLLAGIRAAMLWRQVGGKRWHLLVNRKQMLAATKSLM